MDQYQNTGSMRLMLECIKCAALYEAPGVSACDCCENHANEFHDWIAYHKDAQNVPQIIASMEQATGIKAANWSSLSPQALVQAFLQLPVQDALAAKTSIFPLELSKRYKTRGGFVVEIKEAHPPYSKHDCVVALSIESESKWGMINRTTGRFDADKEDEFDVLEICN